MTAPDRAEQAVRDILLAAGHPQLADDGTGPDWHVVTPGWHVFTYQGKVRVDWWSNGTLTADSAARTADSAALAGLRPALEAAGLTVTAPDGSVLEIAGHGQGATGRGSQRHTRLAGDDLADDTEAAAWAAHRSGDVTWLDDDHGPIAAIVAPSLVEYALRHGWGR